MSEPNPTIGSTNESTLMKMASTKFENQFSQSVTFEQGKLKVNLVSL